MLNEKEVLMETEDLKQRTKQFSLRIIRLVNSLPLNAAANVIGKQLLRSGTSVGANYRSACRARSKADFISKINIAVEESDESEYWMELLVDAGLMDQTHLAPLLQEAHELTAILNASAITARRNLNKEKQS